MVSSGTIHPVGTKVRSLRSTTLYTVVETPTNVEGKGFDAFYTLVDYLGNEIIAHNKHLKVAKNADKRHFFHI